MTLANPLAILARKRLEILRRALEIRIEFREFSRLPSRNRNPASPPKTGINAGADKQSIGHAANEDSRPTVKVDKLTPVIFARSLRQGRVLLVRSAHKRKACCLKRSIALLLALALAPAYGPSSATAATAAPFTGQPACTGSTLSEEQRQTLMRDYYRLVKASYRELKESARRVTAAKAIEEQKALADELGERHQRLREEQERIIGQLPKCSSITRKEYFEKNFLGAIVYKIDMSMYSARELVDLTQERVEAQIRDAEIIARATGAPFFMGFPCDVAAPDDDYARRRVLLARYEYMKEFTENGIGSFLETAERSRDDRQFSRAVERLYDSTYTAEQAESEQTVCNPGVADQYEKKLLQE